MLIETFADTYWAAQRPRLRWFRGKPLQTREAAVPMLQSLGEVVDIAIQVYDWDPLSVMQDRLVTGSEPGILASVDPKDFPRAADLMLTAIDSDLRWPNRKGHPSPGVGDAWYPRASDTAAIGAQFVLSGEPSGGTFQKVLGAAQPGPVPTYYSDWTLDGLIPFWLRIA